MGAPEVRYASVHPALGYSGARFNLEDFLSAVDEDYAILSDVQASQLAAILSRFHLNLTEYHLGTKKIDLETFVGECGNLLDKFVNRFASTVTGEVFIDEAERHEKTKKFKHKKARRLRQSELKIFDPRSDANLSRTTLLHATMLLSVMRSPAEGIKAIKASRELSELDDLRMSVEDTIAEIVKLRGYLKCLALIYSSKSAKILLPGGADQRTSVNAMIVAVHQWATLHRLPRSARDRSAPEGACTKFTTLINSILVGASDWLKRSSMTGFKPDADYAPDDALVGQLDIPENSGGLERMIEKAIKAHKQKRKLLNMA